MRKSPCPCPTSVSVSASKSCFSMSPPSTFSLVYVGGALLHRGVMAGLYEAKPRHFHCAASSGVGGRCFVFAGRTAENTKEELSSQVEVFDVYLERWTSLKTTGSPPEGLCGGGGCCVSSSGDLLVYGGWDGSNFRGGLYKLSSLKWSQLSVESDANGPMKKRGCGLVCFMKNKVAVIGGYGLPHGPPQPGSTFMKNKAFTDGRGWTNEIHILDFNECKLS